MIDKDHILKAKRKLFNVKVAADSPPPTLSPRRRQGTPLSELAMQLRTLQARNREQESIIANQAIKIRLANDVQGVSLEDMRGALARASEAEAHAEMAARIVALEAQIELSHAVSSKNRAFSSHERTATEARIAGLELQVGELEELDQDHRTKSWELQKRLRDSVAGSRRLELMCAMKDNKIEKMEMRLAERKISPGPSEQASPLYTPVGTPVGTLIRAPVETPVEPRRPSGTKHCATSPTKMADEWSAAVKAENDARGAEGQRPDDDDIPSIKGLLELHRMRVAQYRLEEETRHRGVPSDEFAKRQAQQDDHSSGGTAPAEDAESAARVAVILQCHQANTAGGSGNGGATDDDSAGWEEMKEELEAELEAEAPGPEEQTGANETLRERQLHARLEFQAALVIDLQQQVESLAYVGRTYEQDLGGSHRPSLVEIPIEADQITRCPLDGEENLIETDEITGTRSLLGGEENLIETDEIAGFLLDRSESFMETRQIAGGFLDREEDPIEIEGYLWKLGRSLRTKWKRHFFQLIQKQDGVYKMVYGEGPGSPQKVYADNMVPNSADVTSAHMHRQRRYVLRLNVRGKSLYLAAANELDLDRWDEVLTQVLTCPIMLGAGAAEALSSRALDSPARPSTAGLLGPEFADFEEEVRMATALSLSESFSPTHSGTLSSF